MVTENKKAELTFRLAEVNSDLKHVVNISKLKTKSDDWLLSAIETLRTNFLKLKEDLNKELDL
jgi:hypothetical protein